MIVLTWPVTFCSPWTSWNLSASIVSFKCLPFLRVQQKILRCCFGGWFGARPSAPLSGSSGRYFRPVFIWPIVTYYWTSSKRPAVPLVGGSTRTRSHSPLDPRAFGAMFAGLSLFCPSWTCPIWRSELLFSFCEVSHLSFNTVLDQTTQVNTFPVYFVTDYEPTYAEPLVDFFLIVRYRRLWSRYSVLSWESRTGRFFPVTTRSRYNASRSL